MVLIGIVLVAT